MRTTAFCTVLLGVMLAGSLLPVAAEDTGPGVARISLISGDVSVQRGDSAEWVAAAVNAPLVVPDRVVTGTGSRAEVQFDHANLIRLGSHTELQLAQLEHQRYIIEIARGTVTFRMHRDTNADVELSTPSVSVRPSRKGSYRVTVREDGESEITVRSGLAEVFTPRGIERLESGRTMYARGPTSDPEFQIARAIPQDDWDRWNDNRDRHFEQARSRQYVHHSVYGVEDLDSYGDWRHVPPYGWVWVPVVRAGWAPYQHGRWVWVDWYGWTWVSYDPWGWAPFHYGRWFHSGPYGWCWYPGAVRVYHPWRPALVAFFGFGGHRGTTVGIGGGFGRVGWVPLAPYEPFHPWYGSRFYSRHRQTTFVDNSVTVVNNINITNVYRNARIRNAVAAVEADQFARGSTRNMVRVSGNDLHRAGVVRGEVPVVPGRESLRLSNREVTSANLPRNTQDRRFFTRNQPAAVDRVPFEEQRRGIERTVRSTFGGAEAPGSRRAGAVETQPAGRAQGEEGSRARPQRETRTSGAEGWRRIGEAPVAGNRSEAQSRGWRRVGEPEASEAQNLPRSNARPTERGQRSADQPAARREESQQDGWRRFGEPEAQPRGLIRRVPAERSSTPTRAEPAARESQGVSRRDSTDGWRRFGQVQSDSAAPAPTMRQQPRSEPSGRSEPQRLGTPRSSPRQAERRSSPAQPIRVSPPIIRERTTSRAPEARGVGGSVRSAPQPSSGTAPAARGAPSRGGGDARGAARSSGGSRTSRGDTRSGRSR